LKLLALGPEILPLRVAPHARAWIETQSCATRYMAGSLFSIPLTVRLVVVHSA
jgi:hypothetical protein